MRGKLLQMRFFAVVLALTASMLVPLLGPAGGTPLKPASPVSADSGLNDPEEDCDESVPESWTVSGVSDDGSEVSLDIALLIDGVSTQRVKDVMERAAQTYAPIGIDLNVVSQKRVRIPADPPRPGGQTPSAHMDDLFARMKEVTGGTRPQGSDVVHLLTAKDVYFIDQGQPAYGLAGVAECIGGVRYPDRAFSFSEGTGQHADGPRDLSGLIAAHEIGHLMGAHHHYGNCAEGDPRMQENETPCTVMFPYMIIWNAGNFGTVEGTVVRGHAVDFASP